MVCMFWCAGGWCSAVVYVFFILEIVKIVVLISCVGFRLGLCMSARQLTGL